jgi:hypothetical protein
MFSDQVVLCCFVVPLQHGMLPYLTVVFYPSHAATALP